MVIREYFKMRDCKDLLIFHNKRGCCYFLSDFSFPTKSAFVLLSLFKCWVLFVLILLDYKFRLISLLGYLNPSVKCKSWAIQINSMSFLWCKVEYYINSQPSQLTQSEGFPRLSVLSLSTLGRLVNLEKFQYCIRGILLKINYALLSCSYSKNQLEFAQTMR